MQNIVVILGAGIAADAGCPVMSNFFSTARKLHETSRLQGFEKDYELVSNVRHAFLSRQINYQLDVDNLENLFCALEMAITLGGMPGFNRDELIGCRDSFLRLVAMVLERTQAFTFGATGITNPNTRQREYKFTQAQPPKGYREMALFAKECIEQDIKLNIITFNYDIGAEASLLCTKVPFYSTPRMEDSDESVRIYKLHGSVNWYEDERNNVELQNELEIALQESIAQAKVDKSALGETWWESQYVNLSTGNLLGSSKSPILVPPTDDKTKHRNDNSRIWISASRAISSADIVVVCGYSFPETDVFFKNFWALSQMHEHEMRKFFFIDPRPNIVQGKIVNLLGKSTSHILRHIAPTASAGFVNLLKTAKATDWTWID